jgi:hypothetical protein
MLAQVPQGVRLRWKGVVVHAQDLAWFYWGLAELKLRHQSKPPARNLIFDLMAFSMMVAP